MDLDETQLDDDEVIAFLEKLRADHAREAEEKKKREAAMRNFRFKGGMP